MGRSADILVRSKLRTLDGLGFVQGHVPLRTLLRTGTPALRSHCRFLFNLRNSRRCTFSPPNCSITAEGPQQPIKPGHFASRPIIAPLLASALLRAAVPNPSALPGAGNNERPSLGGPLTESKEPRSRD